MPPDEPFRTPGAVALAYIKALVAADWHTVCSTRVPHEREKMARVAGTCENAFQVMLAGKPVGVFATLEVHEVEQRDDLAWVHLAHPGRTEIMTLVARRVGQQWFLEDTADGDTH